MNQAQREAADLRSRLEEEIDRSSKSQADALQLRKNIAQLESELKQAKSLHLSDTARLQSELDKALEELSAQGGKVEASETMLQATSSYETALEENASKQRAIELKEGELGP